MAQPPSIDGHLWVVKDGKIIDPHFPSYDMISRIRKVSNKKNYLPADNLIQKIVIKMWKTFLPPDALDDWTDMPDMCMINAIAYQSKHGGDLVFGSMGFGENKDVWWEYGGTDYKTLKQFIKDHATTTPGHMMPGLYGSV